MFWTFFLATHSFCFSFAIKVSHYYKLLNLQENYELKKKNKKKEKLVDWRKKEILNMYHAAAML